MLGVKERNSAPGKAEDGKALAPVEETPKSIAIAARGIRDDQDAAEYLSALIGDVMTQAVPVRTANTGVNAMGKLLKLVEMRQKYGDPEKTRSLHLVHRPEEETQALRKLLLKQLAELDASGEVVNKPPEGSRKE